MVSIYIYICSQLISSLIFICHHCDFSLFCCLSRLIHRVQKSFFRLVFYLPFFVCRFGNWNEWKKATRTRVSKRLLRSYVYLIFSIVDIPMKNNMNFLVWNDCPVLSPNASSLELGTCEWVSFHCLSLAFGCWMPFISKLPFHCILFRFGFSIVLLLPFLKPTKANNEKPSSGLFFSNENVQFKCVSELVSLNISPISDFSADEF